MEAAYVWRRRIKGTVVAKIMKRPSFFVIPECFNRGSITYWIPAFAGMTIFLLVPFFAFAQEPVVSRVALSQKTIDLAKNEKAVIEFQLNEKAFVDLEIYDDAHTRIQKVVGEKMLPKGKHQLTWDGTGQSGERVISGVYVYVLEARGVKPYRFDLRSQTGGEEVLVENLSWDVPKSTVHYLLPKAGYVRIRIGLKDGIFLGTLQDWTPLEAGKKEFPWDGKDPSGYFDLSKHSEAQINIAAFALADNAVIVKSVPPPQPSPLGKRGEGENISPPFFLNGGDKEGGKYIHARHARFLCHEPKFQIEFPQAEVDSQTKVPIIKGKVPVRITLDPADKNYLASNRFEVMFFVDSVFLFEQEEGTSPLTIDLDPKRIGEGEHLLTINVMDYEDHIGVQTVKVKVTPPPSSPLIKHGEEDKSLPHAVSVGETKRGTNV